jgi:cyclophilin family peptidyl-prolyl cis-trans isomerase
LCVIVLLVAHDARAQATRRLAVIEAEGRGAPTARDLATIRAAARSVDPDTAEMAVRALGRLQRPALVADIVLGLRFRLPEVRAEAAHALGAAFSGLGARDDSPRPLAVRTALASAMSALTTRLGVEDEPMVRAAICEALGRLPYADAAQFAEAQRAIVGAAGLGETVTDRLGVAKGLETLLRSGAGVAAASAEAVSVLRELSRMTDGSLDPTRYARVRRLALEALIAAREAEEVIEQAAGDPDAQVRRLSMRAAWTSAPDLEPPLLEGVLRRGLADPSPLVRIETLGPRPPQPGAAALVCALAAGAAADPDVHVALAAIGRLAACGRSEAAVALLERLADDLSEASAPRRWHRPAHALLALATAAPERVAVKLDRFASWFDWPLRLYAARAAAVIGHRATLQRLADDAAKPVANAAGAALARLGGQAPAALEAPPERTPSEVTAEELRRLAAPRARVTVRGVGTFELALFTSEAPATVVAFAHLAESGFFNGRTFDRALPDSTIEVAAEDPAAPAFGRPELGAWPNVRGSVVLWNDAGGARLMVNTVDNPHLDHRHTVFAQVLNGLELIDDLLEGDLIERIDILP